MMHEHGETAGAAMPYTHDEAMPYICDDGMMLRRVYARSVIDAIWAMRAAVQTEILAFIGLSSLPEGCSVWPKAIEGFTFPITPEPEFIAERGQPGSAAHVFNVPGDDEGDEGEPFIIDPGGVRLFRVIARDRAEAAARVLRTMQARFDRDCTFTIEHEYIAKHGVPEHVIDVGGEPEVAGRDVLQ